MSAVGMCAHACAGKPVRMARVFGSRKEVSSCVAAVLGATFRAAWQLATAGNDGTCMHS